MALRTRGSVEVRQDVDNGRPTIADLQGDGQFALLAKQHWLKSTKKVAKVKVKPDVVKKEIWDVLEREDFSYRSLLILENLQILEKSASSSEFPCYNYAKLSAVTFGQAIQRTPRTTMSYSWH